MSKQGNYSRLLAIDIGNTNIVFGVHNGECWTHQWRAQTVRERMPDEYAVLFRDFFSSVGLSMNQISQSVVSSVVPRLTRGIAEMVRQQTGYAPVIVSAAVNLGIRVNTDQPERVGSDLISNAVAAYERVRSNCIVVDFGTATTFTSVIEPGEMIGVAISAGLYTTLDALVSHTAQLPHIEIAPPPSPIGRNTIHSMQSGLILGHVSMVEGMIGRIKPLMGGATVIGTGGLSAVLGPLTDCFDMVDPWLTLDGLRLIAERNPRQ